MLADNTKTQLLFHIKRFSAQFISVKNTCAMTRTKGISDVINRNGRKAESMQATYQPMARR